MGSSDCTLYVYELLVNCIWIVPCICIFLYVCCWGSSVWPCRLDGMKVPETGLRAELCSCYLGRHSHRLRPVSGILATFMSLWSEWQSEWQNAKHISDFQPSWEKNDFYLKRLEPQSMRCWGKNAYTNAKCKWEMRDTKTHKKTKISMKTNTRTNANTKTHPCEYS